MDFDKLLGCPISSLLKNRIIEDCQRLNFKHHEKGMNPVSNSGHPHPSLLLYRVVKHLKPEQITMDHLCYGILFGYMGMQESDKLEKEIRSLIFKDQHLYIEDKRITVDQYQEILGYIQKLYSPHGIFHTDQLSNLSNLESLYDNLCDMSDYIKNNSLL